MKKVLLGILTVFYFFSITCSAFAVNVGEEAISDCKIEITQDDMPDISKGEKDNTNESKIDSDCDEDYLVSQEPSATDTEDDFIDNLYPTLLDGTNIVYSHSFDSDDSFINAKDGVDYERGGEISSTLSVKTAKECSLPNDHTLGDANGGVLCFTPANGNKTVRFKLMDVFNQNGITPRDIGCTYKISFWMYNPYEESYSCNTGVYSSKSYDQNGLKTSPNNLSTKYATTRFPGSEYSFTVEPKKWQQISYTYTLPSALASEFGFDPSVYTGVGDRNKMKPELFIDDIVITKINDIASSNDSNNLVPFNTYTQKNTVSENISILGNIISSQLFNTAGDYINHCVSNDTYKNRYISDDSNAYVATLRGEFDDDNLSLNATRVDIRKTIISSETSLTEYPMTVENDFDLLSNYDGKLSSETRRSNLLRETMIAFKDLGSPNAIKWGGKTGDVLRSYNIISKNDNQSKISDMNIRKVDQYDALANANFSQQNFEFWGWGAVNNNVFSISNSKLKVGKKDVDNNYITQLTALYKGMKYNLSYDIQSYQDGKVTFEILDSNDNIIKSFDTTNTNGSIKTRSQVIEIPGELDENNIEFCGVKVKIISKNDTDDDYVLIDNVILSQLKEDVININDAKNDKLTVFGNLDGYDISSLEVYLLNDGYEASDINSNEAIYKKGSPDINGNFYSIDFDVSDLTDYYTNFKVVIKGISSMPLFSVDYTYKSLSIKTNLIKAISQCNDKTTLKNLIENQGSPLNYKIAELDLIDVFNDLFVENDGLNEGVYDYVVNNKDKVADIDNPGSLKYLHEIFIQAMFIDAVNEQMLSAQTLCKYLSLYENELGINENITYNQTYKSLSEELKTTILDSVKNYAKTSKINSCNDLINAVCLNTIYCYAKSLPTYKNVLENVISVNKEFLGITDKTWSKYESLAQKYVATAGKYIVDALLNTKDYSNFGSNIESIINNAKSDVDSSKGSSSSSGSTIKSTITLKPSINEEESKDDENNENSLQFDDLNGFEWAKESIENLFSKNIISGYSNNKFMPDKNITRKEFAKLLVLAFDIYDKDALLSFSDVEKSDWSYSYIASLEKLNIAKGDINGKFNGDDNITRQDMASLIVRICEIKNITLSEKQSLTNFNDDNEISDYAKNAVHLLNKAGIISGVGDNLFNPLSPATRAEAAKILNMLI